MPRTRDRNGRPSRLPVTPLPNRKIVVLGLIFALNNCSLYLVLALLTSVPAYFYPDSSVNEMGLKAVYLGKIFNLFYTPSHASSTAIRCMYSINYCRASTLSFYHDIGLFCPQVLLLVLEHSSGTFCGES